MRKNVLLAGSVFLVGSLVMGAGTRVRATDDDDRDGRPSSCNALPSWGQLRAALVAAQNLGSPVLALYAPGGHLLGGLGVSGDTSCADHNIAWRTRDTLDLDSVPAGVNPDPVRKDNIIYDITPQPGQMPGISPSGWGHPTASTRGLGRRSQRHSRPTNKFCSTPPAPARARRVYSPKPH